jgi:lysyl-tRNA synthetase, class I
MAEACPVPDPSGCHDNFAEHFKAPLRDSETSYACACGAVVGPTPIAGVAGKVDWPMRWAYEQVTFEPVGADHASPGSASRSAGNW